MEKDKCPYCGQDFEGFSKKQTDNFIRQHILAKHPEKIVEFFKKKK